MNERHQVKSTPNVDTCRSGRHEWVDENITTNSRGDRVCRICRNEAAQRAYRKRSKKRKPRHCGCGRPIKGRRKICAICKDSRHNNYSIADVDRAFIYERDGHQCLKCGDADNLTIDHILPRAIGGKDIRPNYQTLCQSCNTSKGATYADHRTGANGQLTLALAPPKPPKVPLRDRFMDKVEKQSGGCWVWVGACVSSGTGAMNVDGKLVTAPRVSYDLFVGDIPEGNWVYRSCENQSCVAPNHLFSTEPGYGYGDTCKPWPACAKGHPYTPDNVKIESGRRRCRTCRNESSRRYYERKREREQAPA